MYQKNKISENCQLRKKKLQGIGGKPNIKEEKNQKHKKKKNI